MGNKRTLLAWLVFLGILLLPYSASAGDNGPGSEVRAIRYDLPIILGQNVSVDAVLVNETGDHALAQWHIGTTYRIGILVKDLDTWWLKHQIWIDDKGMASCCFSQATDSRGPTTTLLHQLPDIPPDLADLAAQSLRLTAQADKKPFPCPSPPSHVNGNLLCPGPDVDWYTVSHIPFTSNATSWVGVTGPYEVTFHFASNDATTKDQLTNLEGREPTLAESWLTQDAHGYFFFNATVDSQALVNVQSGTTLDVRFPFVLQTKLRYRVIMTNLDTTIGPAYGTLHDNALHFVLPAFALVPNTTLAGRIEGQ